MTPGRRAGLLAALAAVTGLGVVVRGLAPLAPRAPLPSAARTTEAGVPVPVTAQICPTQSLAVPGGVRWCLPKAVSVRTLDRWYAVALPPGRDAGALRWCVEQRQSDGTRRALWSSGDGLVGYDLPPHRPRPGIEVLEGEEVVVEVLRFPRDRPCPSAARAKRMEQPAAGARS